MSKNKIQVPEAKQAGSIGGQMVKKMIADYESRMK